MSDPSAGLGEWADVDDEPPAGTAAAEPAPAAGVLGGVDVAGLAASVLDETVAEEVRRQVRKQVSVVVADAVAAALTPERLAEIRSKAAEAALAELSPDPAAPEESAEQPAELYYGSTDQFVREMIVPVFRRQVGERAARRWAAEWWRDAEAIIRLEALWRSWEHLRLDPATGTSVWLRDHADHHLAVLMDPDGPFKKSVDEARPGEPLPYAAPPEGLFPDVRDGADTP